MKAIDLHAELNALGIKFEPIGFVKAPAYPYGIYVDDAEIRQPDTDVSMRTVHHTVTIELYHPDLDALNSASLVIEAWLNGYALDYTRRPRFVVDEDHYCLTYTTQYTNKERTESI